MRTIQFTDAGIRKMPIPDKPLQVDWFDNVQRGLGLRISYGGTRSFFVMYTDAGKRQRVSLGEYGKLEHGKLPLADARRKARAVLGDVARNKRPAAEAREARRAPTVRELVRQFIAQQCRLGLRSVAKQERMLIKDVVPLIGDLRAREVKRADIKKIMKIVTERGAPIEANRVQEVLRAMFRFALKEETFGVETNPAGDLDDYRNPEIERDRWLSPNELGLYWRSLPDTAGGDALRISLLTAQRQANVLGMRVDQISLADRMWIIPAGLTKTGKSYRVPLSDQALAIIEERIQTSGSSWIFPKRRGEGPACSTLVGKPHREACARAGIEGYRPHDHRHTFATHCELMGIPRLVWDGLLGHAGATMADRYSGHDFADQRAVCMQRWADRILSCASSNVVIFKSSQAS